MLDRVERTWAASFVAVWRPAVVAESDGTDEEANGLWPWLVEGE